MSEPLIWMRSFEAAARRGTLTLAAMEVGLTQAAVSQQIKALESRLGVQLFQREPRGVSLTGAGTELYAEVYKGLKAIDFGLGKFTRTDTNELYIICSSSLAVRWLTPRLPKFISTYPEINLRLKTVLWQTEAIGVNADVEIFLGEIRGNNNNLTLFHQGKFIAVASPEYMESALQSFVTVTGWDILNASLPIGLTKLEVDNFDSALCLAESGITAAICPSLLAKDALKSGKLVEMDLPLPKRTATYHCACLNRPNTPSELFQEWLIERSNMFL